jgi:hypothetical protein
MAAAVSSDLRTRRNQAMKPMRLLSVRLAAAVAFIGLTPWTAPAACCYFAPKNVEIIQPAQQVFITWDARTGMESFTVQPRFEGNALDFGMVIPTPAKPRLDEMPRDFFKMLEVFTILKKRARPQSRLLPEYVPEAPRLPSAPKRPATVKVLEAGLVGSLDYKIIEAGRADDLYTWLKANKYHYAGDEATLSFYVKKKWLFTVMKIDTMQMKKNKDGRYTGEVTPTRFRFASDKLIYPLKITKLSVKDKTDVLFYVQTSHKVDLPGDMTYQYQWLPMIQNARHWYDRRRTNDLPGKADAWLKATKDQAPDLLRRGQELGFTFKGDARPQPNRQGRFATTLEWAKKLTAEDLRILTGAAPYSEKMPNVDEGFTVDDVRDHKQAEAVNKVIGERMAKCRKERPHGYLVREREAPPADIKQLKLLSGHLKEGQFLTKLRKIFTRGEMDDDLLIVPAKLGQAEDSSEYHQVLPTRVPRPPT